jgi:hypothetical protein
MRGMVRVDTLVQITHIIHLTPAICGGEFCVGAGERGGDEASMRPTLTFAMATVCEIANAFRLWAVFVTWSTRGRRAPNLPLSRMKKAGGEHTPPAKDLINQLD